MASSSNPKNLKGLVFCPYGEGHLNPTLPLIRALVQSHHEIVVFNLPRNKERIEATGATFRSFPNGDGFTIENYCPQGTPFFLQLMYSSEVLIPFVAKMAKEEKPHYIMHDYHLFWVRYVTEVLNIPAICVSPPMLGYLPVYDLVVRDQRSEAIAQKLQGLYGGEVNLETVMTNYEACTLVFCSRYLQPENEKYPKEAGFHFIGPQISMRGKMSPKDEVYCRVESFLSQPSENGIQKHVVYMSMGSLYRPSEPFLLPFIEGIQKIPGVLLVLNVGRAVDLQEFSEAHQYPNVVFVQWAPQLYLLEKASVFVTHCGMNSVVESCCFGCPMLLIPKFADQPTNAIRVEQLGAGILLCREQYAQSDLIRKWTETIIFSPKYRENCAKIGLSLLHYSLSPEEILSLPPSLPSPSQLGGGGEEGARVVEDYVRGRLTADKGVVGLMAREVVGGHLVLAGTPKDFRRASLDQLCVGSNPNPSCC